ncbi:MAG: hypothetical protein COA85_12695 [Robiginitomaculum sp.]|nr:MAG: hypothetical protein COA85_12695 [Robiginitomaculum sp.]
MAKQIFMVTALDHEDSTQKRAHLRPDHLRWIEKEADAFLMAGPLRETADGPVIGSHLLMQARDKDALKSILAEDPYAQGDLFSLVTIAHFQPVTGAWLKT